MVLFQSKIVCTTSLCPNPLHFVKFQERQYIRRFTSNRAKSAWSKNDHRYSRSMSAIMQSITKQQQIESSQILYFWTLSTELREKILSTLQQFHNGADKFTINPRLKNGDVLRNGGARIHCAEREIKTKIFGA